MPYLLPCSRVMYLGLMWASETLGRHRHFLNFDLRQFLKTAALPTRYCTCSCAETKSSTGTSTGKAWTNAPPLPLFFSGIHFHTLFKRCGLLGDDANKTSADMGTAGAGKALGESLPGPTIAPNLPTCSQKHQILWNRCTTGATCTASS